MGLGRGGDMQLPSPVMRSTKSFTLLIRGSISGKGTVKGSEKGSS